MKSKLSKSMAVSFTFVAIACLLITSLVLSLSGKSESKEKEFVSQETTVTKEVISEDILADIMDEMTVLEIGKTDYFAPIEESIEKLPAPSLDSAIKVDNATAKEEVKEEATPETEVKEEVKPETEDKKEEAKPSIYDTMAISTANTYVNMRQEASTDAKVVGKFYKNAVGTIIETKGEWYKVKSGNAIGYVKAEYVATKEAAKKLYPSVSYKVAKVTTNSLNIRKEMSTSSRILDKAKKGETYTVYGIEDKWAKVKVDGKMGYVSTDYVTIQTVTETSKTIEEERKEIEEQKRKEAEEAAKKKAEAERLEAFKQNTPTKTEKTDEGVTAHTASDLDMLVAVIHCEAGYESYEGKVALANVVLNRVRDRRFPNTIKGVLYQKGQFTVVKTSKYKKTLNNYTSNNTKYMKETIKAAKAALAGENNIGNRVFYNGYRHETKRSHKNPLRIGNHLFWSL